MVKHLCTLLVAFFYSCNPHHSPGNFPAQDISGNHSGAEVVFLGRKLFYDPILSGDSTMSCASCHQQSFAFTDSHKALSTGISGKLGKRNSLPLFNLAWGKSFFWDGGVTDLETQMIAPITDENEMHQDLKILLSKLREDNNYKECFIKAFGTDTITTQRIMIAIAEFQRTIISAGSKYDQYIRGEAKLTEAEMKGMLLVKKHCSSCHKVPLFTDHSYHNNGIDDVFPEFSNSLNISLGRARITQEKQDIGKYKTPTLRNVELTAPYMHDGRFSNLEEVLNHYSSNVKYSQSLDSILIKPGYMGIRLTEEEKKLIIKFLLTLTDYELTTNSSYSKP